MQYIAIALFSPSTVKASALRTLYFHDWTRSASHSPSTLDLLLTYDSIAYVRLPLHATNGH